MGTRRIENGVAKEYVWQNYPQVHQRIENYGKGLLKLGLSYQKSVGIYAVNRPEWVKAVTKEMKKWIINHKKIDND